MKINGSAHLNPRASRHLDRCEETGNFEVPLGKSVSRSGNPTGGVIAGWPKIISLPVAKPRRDFFAGVQQAQHLCWFGRQDVLP
jgi:hypothetical protein